MTSSPAARPHFEVEEGDEDDLSDLEALIDATHATGGDWSDGMAATADLDEMTRIWAGEQYIGHLDSYSVRAGANWPNNYYLHSDDTGRFSMLASGLDQAFVSATRSLARGRAARGALPGRRLVPARFP